MAVLILSSYVTEIFVLRYIGTGIFWCNFIGTETPYVTDSIFHYILVPHLRFVFKHFPFFFVCNSTLVFFHFILSGHEKYLDTDSFMFSLFSFRTSFTVNSLWRPHPWNVSPYVITIKKRAPDSSVLFASVVFLLLCVELRYATSYSDGNVNWLVRYPREGQRLEQVHLCMGPRAP